MSESGRTALERLQSNAGTLSALLLDLLNFSKVKKGDMPMRKERFRLERFIETLGPFLSRLTTGKPVELQLNIPSDTWLETDRNFLRSILVALMDNAAKFTDAGFICLEVKPLLPATEIRITDTGIGIHHKDQEAIFGQFRQVDGSSSRRVEGMGLGLAMCKKYAEMLGGSLKVESLLGAGSTFILSLPQSLAPGPGVEGSGRG